MNMQALKQQALAKVEAAYVKAEAHFGVKLTRVPVEFSSQQKSTAGTAHYMHNRRTGTITPIKIKLSLPLLQLNGEEFIKSTPGHEAAHCIAISLFGVNGKGHGAKWQQVMRAIGQTPTRCHSMETAVTRIEVFCNCQSHMVTKQMASKVLAGRRYTCKKCKSAISLKGANIVEPKMAASAPAPRMPVYTAPKAPVVAGASKADIVKLMLRNIKTERKDLSLEQVLSVAAVVEEIAKAAGLTAGLCRTYIKNNWSKV